LKKKIYFVMFFLLLYSCSKNTKPAIMSPDEEYQQIVNLFKEGKYEKAINFLTHFFNRYPGSHWIDDAQFYYAESYFKLKNYMEATNEFQFLLNNFPNSDWSELALLRKAQCLEETAPLPQRDQTLTKEAIEAYDEFIRKYPYSKYLEEAYASKKRAQEKINQKLLEIGETYIKMGINKAAVVYLTKVTGNSEKWNDRANLLLGNIALSNNNDSLAISYYSKVEGELKEKALKKLKEIN
jgi:outer membrane protein assembly factor BamD